MLAEPDATVDRVRVQTAKLAVDVGDIVPALPSPDTNPDGVAGVGHERSGPVLRRF